MNIKTLTCILCIRCGMLGEWKGFLSLPPLLSSNSSKPTRLFLSVFTIYMAEKKSRGSINPLLLAATEDSQRIPTHWKIYGGSKMLFKHRLLTLSLHVSFSRVRCDADAIDCEQDTHPTTDCIHLSSVELQKSVKKKSQELIRLLHLSYVCHY